MLPSICWRLATFLLQGRVVVLVLAAVVVLMLHELICREERFLREHYGRRFGITVRGRGGM